MKKFAKILALYAVGQMRDIIIDSYLISKDKGIELSQCAIDMQIKEIDIICDSLLKKAHNMEIKYNLK